MSEEELPPAPEWEGPLNDNGKPHGKGKMTYVAPEPEEDEDEELQPDTYEGEMQNGKRNGKGTYTWSKGGTFTGDYVNNKKQGKGVLTYPDKSRYEGTFENDMIHGSGTYTYANGDMFMGTFQEGKKHGEGSYFYKDHECQFCGEWDKGAFVKGVWVQKDGTRFEGVFDDSKPAHGKFTFIPSGLEQEGKWNAKKGWNGKAVVETKWD